MVKLVYTATRVIDTIQILPRSLINEVSNLTLNWIMSSGSKLLNIVV